MRSTSLTEAGHTAPEAPKRREDVRPQGRYLLLDDRVIERTESCRLRVGAVVKHPTNPLFGEEREWETDTSHWYPNVIYDREDRQYKLWYYTRIREWRDHVTSQIATPGPTGGGNCATLLALSDDGLRWRRPELDLWRYDGRPTNIVTWGDHGTGVFKDYRDPDPARRFKMVTNAGDRSGRIHVSYSPDGVHWDRFRDTKVATAADTHNNALWDPLGKKYVLISRSWSDGKRAYDIPDVSGSWPQWTGGMRTVVRAESPDFVDWSAPVEVLRGSDSEQIYSMPVFFSGGVFLGLPAIFHAGTDGRVHTELAWSPDTIAWHRIDQGTPLVSLSTEAGTVDRGCVYAAASPVIADGEIRLYYSGQEQPHGWQPGRLCLATLREDRWAGYEPDADGNRARIVTRPLARSGDRLWFSADIASKGFVSVSVVDSSGIRLTASQFHGDGAERRSVRVPATSSSVVRVEFEFAGAKIYSVGFDA